MVIEQSCKMIDGHAAGIELLTIDKQSYHLYLDGSNIYSKFLDVIDYFDLDIRDKLNSNTLPLITIERFYTPETILDSAILNKKIKLESEKYADYDLNNKFDRNAQIMTVMQNSGCFFQEKNDINKLDILTNETQDELPETTANKIPIWQDDNIKIIFLLHGLGGSALNMFNIRSYLEYSFPGTIIFNSVVNEKQLHESIAISATRFAQEVIEYLSQFPINSKMRISFVGHSLGGLIVRAALPHLKQFGPNFYTFMTLGTPHLGADSVNFLVNAGMNFMGYFKGYQSVLEISLLDQNNLLLNLSKIEEISFFKNVIFVANYEDGYVRPESAKILNKFNSKNNNLSANMSRDIYSNIKATNICKVGVLIPDLAKGIDRFIGRQPHVEFLENILVQRVVFSELKFFFD